MIKPAVNTFYFVQSGLTRLRINEGVNLQKIKSTPQIVVANNAGMRFSRNETLMKYQRGN